MVVARSQDKCSQLTIYAQGESIAMDIMNMTSALRVYVFTFIYCNPEGLGFTQSYITTSMSLRC